MKRILLGGLVLSAFALPAPAALAANYDMAGGCSFASASDKFAGQGLQTGEIGIRAIVYSAASPEEPVSATVTCYITVNGAAQSETAVSASGTVAVAGTRLISYVSLSVADDIQLCERVEYRGRFGYLMAEVCRESTRIEIPPPLVGEIITPIVCRVLSQLWGSYSAAGFSAVITTRGDVYIDGELYYDCPPYDGMSNIPPQSIVIGDPPPVISG